MSFRVIIIINKNDTKLIRLYLVFCFRVFKIYARLLTFSIHVDVVLNKNTISFYIL